MMQTPSMPHDQPNLDTIQTPPDRPQGRSDTGTVQIDAHVRIWDPQTGHVYEEGRA